MLTVALVLLLRWVDPPTSAFMLREHMRRRGRRKALRDAATLGRLGAIFLRKSKIAVIASEDQNFPDHYGFDFEVHRQGAR